MRREMNPRHRNMVSAVARDLVNRTILPSRRRSGHLSAGGILQSSVREAGLGMLGDEARFAISVP